jgi:hypothetical protein
MPLHTVRVYSNFRRQANIQANAKQAARAIQFNPAWQFLAVSSSGSIPPIRKADAADSQNISTGSAAIPSCKAEYGRVD